MFKVLEGLSGRMVKPMTTADEVREFLCAVPRTHTDTRETWLRRASAFLGLTPRKARSVWYREKVRIDHDEYERMRVRIDELRQAQLKRREILDHVDALVGAVPGMPSEACRSCGDAGSDALREGSEAPRRPGAPVR